MFDCSTACGQAGRSVALRKSKLPRTGEVTYGSSRLIGPNAPHVETSHAEGVGRRVRPLAHGGGGCRRRPGRHQ
jgi:hypothetical protein